MKRTIWIIMAVLAGLGFGLSARAMAVISTDMPTASTITPFTYADLKGTTLTNLNTSLTDITSAHVLKRGNEAVYTSTQGIVKQTIGTETVAVLKTAADVVLINSRGAQTVISNNATANNKGSYLFNVSTKKAVTFKPKVTNITQARIAPNNKWVALLGKDSKGGARLFVSGKTIGAVTAYRLPAGATGCPTMEISPDSKILALVCEIKAANGSTTNTIILRTMTGTKLGKEQKYTQTNFTVYSLVWKDKDTIIGLGFGPAATASAVDARLPFTAQSVHALTNSPFSVNMYKYSVKNGKIVKRAKYSFSTTAIVDQSYFVLPMQMVLSSKNVVDYMALYFQLDDNGQASALYSYISRYNLLTKKQTLLLKNDRLNFFAQYQMTEM